MDPEKKISDPHFLSVPGGPRESTSRSHSTSPPKGGRLVDALVCVEEKRNSKGGIRRLVSKKKRRWAKDGFDLDLTYITERVIAMGFPAETIERFYRNSMRDVQRFLEQRHSSHYRIYNLCSERRYDHAKFNHRVAEFPFDDHQAPPLSLLFPFCKDVCDWLNDHPENVAAVHCKAGKGRTGVMVCCLLLYTGQWETAEESLKYYGFCRTRNQKGVTIPSQMRYVYYFEQLLKRGLTWHPPPSVYRLVNVRVVTIPKVNLFGGCDPFFNIKNAGRKFSSKSCGRVPSCRSDDPFVDIAVDGYVLFDDCKFELFHKTLFGKEKLCQLWFNTTFIENNTLVFKKADLDKAYKDKDCKRFDANFSVIFTFAPEDPSVLTTLQLESATAKELTDRMTSTTWNSPVPLAKRLHSQSLPDARVLPMSSSSSPSSSVLESAAEAASPDSEKGTRRALTIADDKGHTLSSRMKNMEVASSDEDDDEEEEDDEEDEEEDEEDDDSEAEFAAGRPKSHSSPTKHLSPTKSPKLSSFAPSAASHSSSSSSSVSSTFFSSSSSSAATSASSASSASSVSSSAASFASSPASASAPASVSVSAADSSSSSIFFTTSASATPSSPSFGSVPAPSDELSEDERRFLISHDESRKLSV
eukprot:GILI01007017.1.p1 GENE.GILI01007017.1~~GILI01007017.1.p1  ORF type:complete len:642 (+),score=181.18 GILI01007017.1:133-2058(+)